MQNKTKFDVNWQVWAEDTEKNKHYLLSFAQKEHAELFWNCESPHNTKIRNEIFDSFSNRGILIQKIFILEDFHY
jgi:hypothetical protein